MDMTRQVHEAGGKIVAQISHAGIFANTSLTGEAAIGPMVRRQSDATICREMTSIDIRKTVKAFANSSRLVKEAGFDGVQIHAAHGYLLSSFLSPHYNTRRDEYGGTAENRSRFLLEVVQAVRSSTGSNFPVLVKMNANDFLANGIGIDDMIYTATALETSGVSAIELSGGTLESGKMVPARRGSIKPENEGYYKEEARYFKKNVGIPLILVGGFRTLSVAEQFLQEGICDFIAMARPFICEPDLIIRWKNREQNYSSCNSDNLCYLPVHAGKGLYCHPGKKKKSGPRPEPANPFRTLKNAAFSTGDFNFEIIHFLNRASIFALGQTPGPVLFFCVPEATEVTEIGPVFFHNPFSLIFPAVIVSTALIKNTVQTTVKIRTAARTLRLSADWKILRYFLLTEMTDFHI
jgi:2,4-dienoyl-CoA reductase-like NADH-dependent reductase (Old Yellow Enzyme family)